MVISSVFAEKQDIIIRLSPVWNSNDVPPADKWEKILSPTRSGKAEELWISKEGENSLLISKEDIIDARIQMTEDQSKALKNIIPFDSMKGKLLKEAFEPTPVLTLKLSEPLKQSLAKMTQENQNKRVAFFVDGKFITALQIIEPIEDGTISIMGGLWSKEDAELVLKKINQK